MITTIATAKAIRSLLLTAGDRVWLSFRFTREAADALCVDFECGRFVDFVCLENRNIAGDVLWLIVATERPSRLTDHDRQTYPILAAGAMGPMLDEPRLVKLSERWAAVIARAGHAT